MSSSPEIFLFFSMLHNTFPVFIAASVINCDLLTESVEFFKIFILFSRKVRKFSGKSRPKSTKSRPNRQNVFFYTEYCCNYTKTLHGVITIRKACSTNFLKKSGSWAIFSRFFRIVQTRKLQG